MKRILFIGSGFTAFVGGLLLMGCSSTADEPELIGEIIEFSAPIVMGTPEEISRAQRLDAFPAGEVFGVSGYCVPAAGASEDLTPDFNAASREWTEKKSRVYADVMCNQPIKFDGTKCVYRDAEGVRYYEPAHWYLTAGSTNADPTSFLYSFIAWHPYEGSYFSVPERSVVGVPQFGFTMPFEAGKHTENLDPTTVKDVMVAFTPDRRRTVDNVRTVPLTFRHILCSLRFQINNFNTSTDVTVHSLTLRGKFYRSGMISFADETYRLTVNGDDEDMYEGQYVFLNEDMTIGPNNARIAGAEMGADGHSDGVAVLLLPHFEGETDRSYLGREKKIEITYSFQEKNDDGTLKRSTKTIDFTLNRRPVAGTLYTVNLSFIGEQLMVSFSDSANNSWSWDGVETGNNTIK